MINKYSMFGLHLKLYNLDGIKKQGRFRCTEPIGFLHNTRLKNLNNYINTFCF